MRKKSMKKRIFSIVLTVIMVFCTVFTSDFAVKDAEAATADTFVVGGIIYEVLVEPTSSNGFNGELKVKGIEDKTVTNVTLGAQIKHNNFIYPVTCIGTSAFENCTKLETIYMPSSVKTIEDKAFKYCTNLNITSLPVDLKSIGIEAFYYCENLALASLPEGVTSIGAGAFFLCGKLALTALPEGLLTIEKETFYGCCNIVLDSLPSGLKIIRDGAFENCASLALTSLPENITSIGNKAFRYCANLALTSLPENITSIGKEAFRECYNLALTSLPDKLTSIGASAFVGCKKIKLTSLPSGVTSIGDYAFQDCISMELPSLPAGVESIGKYAFQGCSNLTLSSWPTKVTSIAQGTFSGCEKLSWSSLPSWITSIGDYAFSGCSNLELTSLLEKTTSIGAGTFKGCSKLTLTSLPSGVTSIGTSAFSGCSSLALTSLPSGVTSIGDNAFDSCSSLALTSLPGGVTSIGERAFSNCGNLAITSLPSGVTSIGNYAFYGCKKLTSLSVAAITAPSLDATVFSQSGLNTLYVPFGSSGYTSTNGWISNAIEYPMISGTVTDDNNTPLSGVNVILKVGDTTTVARTGTDGKYSLLVVGGTNYSLRVNKGGYITKNVTGTISGQSETKNFTCGKLTLNSEGYYELTTADDMEWFATLVNADTTGGSINAMLLDDISLNNYFSHIGTNTKPYRGTFDGDGHTVTVNYINLNKKYTGGVFDVIGEGAIIKNLAVDGTISTLNQYVGGVVSYGKENNTVFDNVLSSVDIISSYSGNSFHSGIIGQTKAVTMTNCGYSGTITAKSGTYCAGLVGWAYDAVTINNCYMAGTMTLSSNSGSGTFCCKNASNTGLLITNSYYINSYGTTKQGTAATKGDFTSGKITYLLNGSKSTPTAGKTLAWYQDLAEGGDEYPVLDSAHGIVYFDEEEGQYTNSDPSIITYAKLTSLITKVNGKLSDGTYNGVNYTTASIAKLRQALIAASAVKDTAQTSEIETAYNNLKTASTVSQEGLITATKHITGCFTQEQQNKGDITGSGWYADGDTVTLKATPRLGYVFSKWSNTSEGTAISGAGAEYSFVVNTATPTDYFVWFGNVPYTLNITSAVGGTASITAGEKSGYDYGDNVTVKAVASANYQFVNWQTENGVVLSSDSEYVVTMLGDTTIVPYFTEKAADKEYVTVSFYHQSGKVIGSQIVEKDTGKVTALAAPIKNGYTFVGWTTQKGSTEVCDFNTDTFSENTSLYPVFTLNEEEKFSVTVKYENLEDEVTEYTPQTSVTVTAEDPAPGYKFTGWKTLDGTYVSYDVQYTFIIASNMTLIPEYVLTSVEIEKKPSIYVNAPIYNDKEAGISQTATMYFNYDLPDGYTLKDIGVIYAAGTKNALTIEDVNGTDTILRSAYSTIINAQNAAKNQFYYYKTVTNGGGNYTLCGYIVVESSKGREVFYTALTNAEYQN